MARCVKCGRDTGFIGLVGFNMQTSRCGSCEGIVRAALSRFRKAFLDFCSDGIISAQEWELLQRGASYDGLDINEALAFIRGDAFHFLQRTLAFAEADGIVTEEEERNILYLQKQLALPNEIARPILQRLSQLRYITQIKQGKLPTLTTGLRLEAGEICHMEMLATYHKVNSKSITYISGQLLATNRKLRFLSHSGGNEIAWNSIMNINQDYRGIYLQLTKKSGNGFYQVADPLLAEAVIDTLVRMAKRQLVGVPGAVSTRHIPQDVKIAVWQRDQGKCTQCGAQDYLEFDHIIPFSKGGASTTGNVQILCRRCNLQKGDRI